MRKWAAKCDGRTAQDDGTSSRSDSSRERVEAISRLPPWRGKLFFRETGVARVAALTTRLVCVASAKEFCVLLTLAQVHPTMSWQILRGRPRRTSSAADVAVATVKGIYLYH